MLALSDQTEHREVRCCRICTVLHDNTTVRRTGTARQNDSTPHQTKSMETSLSLMPSTTLTCKNKPIYKNKTTSQVPLYL